MRLPTGRNPARTALQAICVPAPRHKMTAVIEETIADPAFAWAELLELAINGKVICLLAETLTSGGVPEAIPPRLLRFLGRELRCNLHATRIYRAEVVRIAAAARQAGITCAAVKGIAAESALYGGRGARQFSDIDPS